jgi:D-glycero-alpha-D-manno-heptose 1-phosphate guanylyltransferase
MDVSEALILAGGLGTRLRPVVSDRPKPLADVEGRPFIAHLFDQLLQYGYARAILCIGHLAERVVATFGDRYGGLSLAYSAESEPLGTAGALALAGDQLHGDHALVMNGDSLCVMDLAGFAAAHQAFGGEATIAVLHQDDRSRAGGVVVDATGLITSFEARPKTPSSGLINAGVYMFNSGFIRGLPKRRQSLEEDVFPSACRNGTMFGWQVAGPFLDIGTPESYRAAPDFVQRLRPS